jgi:hypothetical protein
MPWTTTDKYRIRKALELAPTDSVLVDTQTTLITDETEIADIQRMLTDIDEIEVSLKTSAASDAIEELVGDVKFREGGQTSALLRRKGYLIRQIKAGLGFVSYNYAPMYRV